MGTHVVGDDEAAIGPSHQHRSDQIQRRYHRRDIVGPEASIDVMLLFERLVRHAVAPVVERYQAKLIREIAVELVCLGQIALRPAVNQKDGRRVRITPFPYV